MQSGVQQMGTDAGEDHSPPPLPGPMRCYRGLFFEGAWIRKILKTSTYVTQQIAVLFKAPDWQDSGGETEAHIYKAPQMLQNISGAIPLQR